MGELMSNDVCLSSENEVMIHERLDSMKHWIYGNHDKYRNFKFCETSISQWIHTKNCVISLEFINFWFEIRSQTGENIFSN